LFILPTRRSALRGVSPQSKGKSGLGFEAQRAAIQRFAEAEGFTLIAEHARDRDATGFFAFRVVAASDRTIGLYGPINSGDVEFIGDVCYIRLSFQCRKRQVRNGSQISYRFA
jgi:hypothetical protein